MLFVGSEFNDGKCLFQQFCRLLVFVKMRIEGGHVRQNLTICQRLCLLFFLIILLGGLHIFQRLFIVTDFGKADGIVVEYDGSADLVFVQSFSGFLQGFLQ